TTSVPDQQFILTVQWEKGNSDPVWSLYETNGGDSKMVFSQPFPNQELEFMYEILAMSTGPGESKQAIPDSLKPEERGGGRSSEPSHAPMEPAPNPYAPQGMPGGGGYPAYPPQPQPMGGYPPPQPMGGYPPGYPAMPYPQAPMQPPMPQAP